MTRVFSRTLSVAQSGLRRLRRNKSGSVLVYMAVIPVLAGALAKHAHNASRGSWVGSVVKKTVFPFAGILVLSTVLGWYAQNHCPDATSLNAAVNCANPR